MTTKAEKLALISELQSCSHEFINPEGVDYFTVPFGFKGRTYVARDSRHKHKGLTLPTGPGSKAEGQDGPEIALQIARHLGLNPPTWQSGRGFRMRTFCAAIREHLETLTD